MICPSCGNRTEGTETSPGTVSSTCPPCNLKLTGKGHHPDAYDTDTSGNLIAATSTEPPARPAPKLDKRKHPRS